MEEQRKRDEKDRTMEKISLHLSHTQDKMHDYSQETDVLRRELAKLKGDTDVIRQKANLLDRTRKLGYMDVDAPRAKKELQKAQQLKSLKDPQRKTSVTGKTPAGGSQTTSRKTPANGSQPVSRKASGSQPK